MVFVLIPPGSTNDQSYENERHETDASGICRIDARDLPEDEDVSNPEDMADYDSAGYPNAFGGQEDEDEAILECSNITNMSYNHKALMDREADEIFMQEHKLKGSALKQVADTLKEGGWTLQCGPCDDSTKKTNAGVGAMTFEKSKTMTIKVEILTEKNPQVCQRRKSWQI